MYSSNFYKFYVIIAYSEDIYGRHSIKKDHFHQKVRLHYRL